MLYATAGMANNLLKLTTGINWHTNKSNFYDVKDPIFTLGCINISPYWFQLRREVCLLNIAPLLRYYWFNGIYFRWQAPLNCNLEAIESAPNRDFLLYELTTNTALPSKNDTNSKQFKNFLYLQCGKSLKDNMTFKKSLIAIWTKSKELISICYI